MSLLTDHGIGFPIPNAATQVNDRRAFLNGYSILDLAAPLSTAIALAPLFLTSQVGVKVATTSLIGIDILLNPLRADAWLIIIFKVTLDLLWAPVLADHLCNSSPSPNRIQNADAGNL